MVQVTCKIDFTNFGDLDMFWGQARDFIKNRTYNEMKRLNDYFNECYNDNDLSLTALNDILAYDSDSLLENALGYLKDQNGEFRDPDILTDINNDFLSYAQFEQVIFNQTEIDILDKTKDFILNAEISGNSSEDLYFNNWIKRIQEENKTEDPEIENDLENLLDFEFDNNLWIFND